MTEWKVYRSYFLALAVSSFYMMTTSENLVATLAFFGAFVSSVIGIGLEED